MESQNQSENSGQAEPITGTSVLENESEPLFENPKETQCWSLYKKMSDKGVDISYDTILRGILTPTEYRLRNKLRNKCT